MILFQDQRGSEVPHPLLFSDHRHDLCLLRIRSVRLPGLRSFPSVGMTAIPSPMIFCENTGSGTSSNGTALPVSGDSINTFLPSSLLINCSLPDILLRPAFLLCPVSCFCKIAQPLALNIISLHCFFKCIFYIFQVFYFLHNLFCPVLCNFPVVLSTPEMSLLFC